MKKTRHCYVAYILTVLISFLLPWQLMGERTIKISKHKTAPPDYRFQTRLDVRPENDRFTVRVINASSEAQLIDVKTVHHYNIWFHASKKTEKTEKRETATDEVAGAVETPVGTYTRFSDEILSQPMYETIAGAIVTNNPVSLRPSAYAGIYLRSAELAIFEPLKSVVYEAKSGDFWDLGYPLTAELPGPDGKPVTDRFILSPNPIRMTRDMIYKILNARRRMDLEEKKMSSEESPKDIDRFRLYLNLAADTDALMADVVCVNPDPGKDEPRTWPPHSRQIHMKTLSNTSWQWHVKAGYDTLYESQQTVGADNADDSKSGNCPKLEKGQLVGRIVRFSESPMFPAVEKFFAETQSSMAKCDVRLKLKLYLPDEDGNPREVGDLFSDWVVVTRQDYQQILKYAVEHARKEKPQ